MVWITGDMHGDYDRFKDKSARKIKKGDFLIVCGDFGFVWDNSKAELKFRQKIASGRFTTLFIEGINENFEILNSFPDTDFCGGKAKKLGEKLYMLKMGEVYSICEKTFFCFGRGDITDADEYSASAFADETDLEFSLENLKRFNNKVDYCLTHDAPSSVKQFLGIDSGGHISSMLDRIMHSIDYGKWFFAKYHTDKQISFKMCSVFKKVHPLYDTCTDKRKKPH